MASSPSRYPHYHPVLSQQHNITTSTTPGQAITSSIKASRHPIHALVNVCQLVSTHKCQAASIGQHGSISRNPSLSRYGLDGPGRSRTCHTAVRSPTIIIPHSNKACAIALPALAGSSTTRLGISELEIWIRLAGCTLVCIHVS